MSRCHGNDTAHMMERGVLAERKNIIIDKCMYRRPCSGAWPNRGLQYECHFLFFKITAPNSGLPRKACGGCQVRHVGTAKEGTWLEAAKEGMWLEVVKEGRWLEVVKGNRQTDLPTYRLVDDRSRSTSYGAASNSMPAWIQGRR